MRDTNGEKGNESFYEASIDRRSEEAVVEALLPERSSELSLK